MMLAASRQALPPVRLLCLAIAATSAAPLANAAFIEDSTASLTVTNIYLNRDFRENTQPRSPTAHREAETAKAHRG